MHVHGSKLINNQSKPFTDYISWKKFYYCQYWIFRNKDFAYNLNLRICMVIINYKVNFQMLIKPQGFKIEQNKIFIAFSFCC